MFETFLALPLLRAPLLEMFLFLCFQILKLNAWEPSYQKLVTDIRKEEISVLKKLSFLTIATSFLWHCAPFLVSLVTL